MLTIKALTDSRLRPRAQLKDAETQRNSDAKYVLYFFARYDFCCSAYSATYSRSKVTKHRD